MWNIYTWNLHWKKTLLFNFPFDIHVRLHFLFYYRMYYYRWSEFLNVSPTTENDWNFRELLDFSNLSDVGWSHPFWNLPVNIGRVVGVWLCFFVAFVAVIFLVLRFFFRKICLGYIIATVPQPNTIGIVVLQENTPQKAQTTQLKELYTPLKTNMTTENHHF